MTRSPLVSGATSSPPPRNDPPEAVIRSLARRLAEAALGEGHPSVPGLAASMAHRALAWGRGMPRP